MANRIKIATIGAKAKTGNPGTGESAVEAETQEELKPAQHLAPEIGLAQGRNPQPLRSPAGSGCSRGRDRENPMLDPFIPIRLPRATKGGYGGCFAL